MRGNELSTTKRERIIGAYSSGVKQKVISAQLNIPSSTVSDTIKRYKETGSAIPEKRSGRPKVLTQRDTRAPRRIIRTDRFSPLGDIINKLNFSLTQLCIKVQPEDVFMKQVLAVILHVKSLF
jgi:transposase